MEEQNQTQNKATVCYQCGKPTDGTTYCPEHSVCLWCGKHIPCNKLYCNEQCEADQHEESLHADVLVDCEDCAKIKECIEREEKKLEAMSEEDREYAMCNCPRLAYDGVGIPRGYHRIFCGDFEKEQ